MAMPESTEQIRTRLGYILEREVKSTDDWLEDIAEALFLQYHAVRRHEETIERMQRQIDYLMVLVSPH